MQITPAGAATVTRTATSTELTRTATVKVTSDQPFDIAAYIGAQSPTAPSYTYDLHVTVRP